MMTRLRLLLAIATPGGRDRLRSELAADYLDAARRHAALYAWTAALRSGIARPA
jgi:hypothetical protein